MLGNALPFLVGPLLLGGVHGYTLLSWMAFRILETCDGHSGYDFAFMPARLLPFSGRSADHAAHHAINTGFFESFLCAWERVMGTCIDEAVMERSLFAKEGAGGTKAE